MSGPDKPYYTSRPSHYGRPQLGDALLEALTAAGKDIDNLAPNDLAPFENLHVRGRAATRDLARLAGLRRGDRILHVGCGIGGPARTLAVEYGCHVTGVDIAESYVDAGRLLTERVGLDDAVSLHVGNALDLSYGDTSFDVVWMQHVGMYVSDKTPLYHEARRVLRPRGKLAMHEIVAGGVSPPHYPTPWASDPSTSFLVSPDRMREALIKCGLAQVEWQDDTPNSIEWARKPVEAGGSGGLSDALDALLGPDYRERIENVRRNLIEERIEVVQAVFTTA
ncbi:MAG: class I SAM-dependent methyltransferase [Chloroflexota bacterium]|nr:class I SAM-dependent methyltransferase [Chloroflexota bacterium]